MSRGMLVRWMPAMGWIPAMAAGALAACAEYDMGKGSFSASTDATTSAPADTGDSDSATSTPSTDYSPTPAWWSVELGFEVLGGELVGKPGPAVTVDLWTDSVPPTPLCRQAPPVVSAEAEAPPELPLFEGGETVGIVGWWRLELDAGAEYECPEFGARTVWFGLGPYDPRLDPAMDAAGLLGTALYGLYVRVDADGPVYIVGVAGTAEMYDGGYGPDPEAPPPVPDGVYTAESLILLAL